MLAPWNLLYGIVSGIKHFGNDIFSMICLSHPAIVSHICIKKTNPQSLSGKDICHKSISPTARGIGGSPKSMSWELRQTVGGFDTVVLCSAVHWSSTLSVTSGITFYWCHHLGYARDFFLSIFMGIYCDRKCQDHVYTNWKCWSTEFFSVWELSVFRRDGKLYNFATNDNNNDAYMGHGFVGGYWKFPGSPNTDGLLCWLCAEFAQWKVPSLLIMDPRYWTRPCSRTALHVRVVICPQFNPLVTLYAIYPTLSMISSTLLIFAAWYTSQLKVKLKIWGHLSSKFVMTHMENI